MNFKPQNNKHHKNKHQNNQPQPEVSATPLQRYRRLLNAMLFQLGWWTCVLMGQGPGLLLALALVGVHIALWGNTAETRLLFKVALLGSLIDTGLMHLGVITFPNWEAAWIPPWLMLLWLLFATTLRHALDWLAPHPVLAAGLGALGGASSYLAGGTLGAAALPLGTFWSMLIFGLIWALLTPALLRYAHSGQQAPSA